VLVGDETVAVQEDSAAFVFTDFGSYEIKIIAKDEAGNEAVYSFTVNIVEDEKPVIEDVELIVTKAGNEERVSLPATGTITVSDLTATLTFRATDDVELVEVKVDGATLALTTDGSYSKQLTLGTENVITIVAKDNKGQESTFTATVHVKVDKLPTVKDVSVVIGNKTIIAENDTSTSVVFAEIPESGMLTFTATDDIGLQSYTVYVNDVPWYYQGVIGSGLQISKTIEIPVEEGENQIEIKAVDKSGQEALYSFVVVITLDTTAPAVEETDPQQSATGVAVDKVITVTFSEPVQLVEGKEITLEGPEGATVAIEVEVEGKVLTIRPSGRACI